MPFFFRKRGKASEQAPKDSENAASPPHIPRTVYPVGIKPLSWPDSPIVEYEFCVMLVTLLPLCQLTLCSIVFVHGLTGNREETWTEKSAAQPWPGLLLPKDIPEARISTFGYDADVAKFLGTASQNRIRDHGRNLLADIADLRENSDTVGTATDISKLR
jgi:hypothetical protein